jgi:transcriptional regulator with XRE-family HTH domain
MNEREKLLELRNRTGMNRREFCQYFNIPYRTVQDWELGARKMPAYLLELMEFKANAVNLKKEKKNQKSAEALGKDEGKETGKDNEN